MMTSVKGIPTQPVTCDRASPSLCDQHHQFTGWVRIQPTGVIRTRLISVLMAAKMQRLEVVRGRSEFLSHFSVPQANSTQPVRGGQQPHSVESGLGLVLDTHSGHTQCG